MPLSPTNSLSWVFPSHNTDVVGFYKWWWQRIKCETETEAIFGLEQRNYKVYANILDNVQMTKRFSVVVDTGAGSSFIRIHDCGSFDGK